MSSLPLGIARKSFHKELGLAPSAQPAKWSGGTAGILPDERKRASFDVTAMMNVFDGGPEKTARRRWIQGSTKDYANFVVRDVKREELIPEHVNHFMDIHSDFMANPKFKLEPEDVTSMFQSRVLNGFVGVHYGLFVSTLRSQASDEQLGWWLEKALRLQLIGCYAQTELGHGSNVRGLQTTATFDPATDEFVIDTNTLSGMKFWPTGLVSSTHCVLYAQLITQGKDLGVHVFFVQLRGADLKPLPGVEMGDVGTKVGDNQADIGYLILNKVRIPRTHLLARRQHVTRDGTYVKVGGGGASSSKLVYLTMLQTRASMVSYSGAVLSEACTIAIRYSAVRYQGFAEPSTATYKDRELKIIEYPVQRHRLLKRLSQAIVMRVSGTRMREMTSEKLGNDDITELHATSSILKALCTTLASAGIEECRKCCGGVGYLCSSGVGELEAWWKGPFETAEGDPTILTLQTARYLMKVYQQAKKGEAGTTQLGSIFSRLKDPAFNPLRNGRSASLSAERIGQADLDALVALFEYRSLVCTSETGMRFEKSLAQLRSFDRAWNENLRSLHTCATVHGSYFMLKTAVDWVKSSAVGDKHCRAALEKVIAYFALSDFAEGIMWAGLLSYEDAQHAERALDRLSADLRNDMVALVDAFDISDATLNSVLGRYDGNVYEAIYEAAVKSPLNMNADGSRVLVPSYFSTLEKFLDKSFLGKATTRVQPAGARL